MTMLLRAVLLIAAFCSGSTLVRAEAGGPMPLFDAHLHYNWEPTPRYPLDTVLELFRDQRIRGILATSRPNDGTRALVEANPDHVRVVPFIRPYIVRDDIQTWFDDPKLFALIESEFKRGYYRGIGEFHLIGQAAASQWVRHMVDFAVRNDLILHAHADDEALELLFHHNPRVRIIWAHTGFDTPPEKLAALLDRYPQLWGELSYRYGITEDGVLTPEWRALFQRFPERFMVGSDTWTDARWTRYGEIMDGYRNWLAQLPGDVAENIAYGNAERLFGIAAPR
jgi:hypothetical protein